MRHPYPDYNPIMPNVRTYEDDNPMRDPRMIEQLLIHHQEAQELHVRHTHARLRLLLKIRTERKAS